MSENYWTPDGEIITEEAAEDFYREYLNLHDSVSVEGIEFDPAEVLETLDPIGYREGFLNYADTLVKDGEWLEEDPAEDDEEDEEIDWEQYWEDFDKGLNGGLADPSHPNNS